VINSALFVENDIAPLLEKKLFETMRTSCGCRRRAAMSGKNLLR